MQRWAEEERIREERERERREETRVLQPGCVVQSNLLRWRARPRRRRKTRSLRASQLKRGWLRGNKQNGLTSWATERDGKRAREWRRKRKCWWMTNWTKKKKSWKRERGNGEKLDWQASERERRWDQNPSFNSFLVNDRDMITVKVSYRCWYEDVSFQALGDFISMQLDLKRLVDWEKINWLQFKKKTSD